LLEARQQLKERDEELEGIHANFGNLHSYSSELSEENQKLQAELTQVRSQLSPQTAPQDSKILDWPDAADLLNQLKSKRKKSKTDLQDVEAILEMLPEMPAQQPQPEPQTQTQLPDLYAARDKLFEMPSLGGWKLEKGEKRERFWAFANALIEESAKLDPNYSLLARLQSDLKQEQEYSRGIAKGMSEEFTKRVNLEKRMGLRKL
jgi:regulator of replication initiation timing